VVINEETQFWGDAVVLERRYVEGIADGILNGGLSSARTVVAAPWSAWPINRASRVATFPWLPA
jgi:hypothetical protein